MSSKLFWQIVLLIVIASFAIPVIGTGVKIGCYTICKSSKNCPIMSKMCPMMKDTVTTDKSAS